MSFLFKQIIVIHSVMAISSVKVYSPNKIYPFVKSQNISNIRKNKSIFTDNFFPPSLSVLGNNSSSIVKDLCKSMQLPGQSLQSLSTKLKWERAKVFLIKIPS